ncbi:hypothetical protein [Nostoc favosum]|uniref:Photosystem I reaction center subunit VIII n=1 Tax=Nostoc favosum CHAB5714 TaxID=2780399 RepID=A0ABS8I2M8_9NOSO|nr:hypothetical protein [Nostoc favosum]MCC5598365.1 hypothetical protein [Nostoc favosum CHAB5714]
MAVVNYATPWQVAEYPAAIAFLLAPAIVAISLIQRQLFGGEPILPRDDCP